MSTVARSCTASAAGRMASGTAGRGGDAGDERAEAAAAGRARTIGAGSGG